MSQTNELRLISRHHTDISLTFNTARPVASPSLRRGVAYVSAKLPRGGVLDVGTFLGVDYDTAWAVVHASPDVASYLHSGFIEMETVVHGDDAAKQAVSSDDLASLDLADSLPVDFSDWTYRQLDKYLRSQHQHIPRNASKAALVELANALERDG